jgi:hypothetical protein
MDLSATGPAYFTMNGYNFGKKIADDGSVLIYLPFYCVGIVSGNRIYFDTNNTFMLDDFRMELWSDTLNYAMSTDPNINEDLNDQRKNLQNYLNEKRAREVRETLASIAFTAYDIYSDSEEEDDLTDYDDFYDTDDDTDEDYDEGHFVGNEIPVY